MNSRELRLGFNEVVNSGWGLMNSRELRLGFNEQS